MFRWEVLRPPGVPQFQQDAIAKTEAIACRLIADRIDETKVATSRVSVSLLAQQGTHRAFAAILRVEWTLLRAIRNWRAALHE